MTSQDDSGSRLDWDPFPGQSFGVNGALVWIFLDELKQLDLDRGIEVWDAYAVARDRGYEPARAAAEHVAEKQRHEAWVAAREAASIATRERLGASPVTTEVADVLADVAGSLVVRDLVSRHDFRLLQFPWTWRGGRVGALAGATALAESAALTEAPALARSLAYTESAAFAAAPVYTDAPALAKTPVHAEPPVYARTPARTPARPPATAVAARARPAIGATLGRAAEGLAGYRLARTGARAITIIVTVTVLAIVTRLAPDAALFGPSGSDAPGSSVVSVGGPSPVGSAVAIASPGSTAVTPHATPPGATAGPKPTKVPVATPAPTQPPAPTPRPTPAPTPAPTPKPPCVVPLLIGISTAQAQHRWNGAGFTGTVFFSPAPPPSYKIQWQSLTPDSKTSCNHDINVADHAP